MSSLLAKCRGSAKEDALTLAVGEKLVASAVSLKTEMNCWLGKMPFYEEATERMKGQRHVDTGSILYVA